MIFSHDGVNLYYEIQGVGKPTLLLHGWMGNADSFLPLRRDLTDRCLIVPEFPGQGGRTMEPPVAWSVTEHMEMIFALLSSLKLSRVDVVAHSFGGRVALLLASCHPSLVDRLVLTGCAGLIPQKTSKSHLRSVCYRCLRGMLGSGLAVNLLGKKRVEAMREALIQRFGSSDYRALAPSMRLTFNRVVTQDLGDCLPQIKAPTLLYWGALDTQTPLWMGRRMEKEIPDAGLIVMENAGHFAYLDEYQNFLAVVRVFLKGADD